jgi:hypothetical protein
MDDTHEMLLGVQVTLLGLLVATVFDGVGSYPLAGILLGAVGTMVVAAGLLDG